MFIFLQEQVLCILFFFLIYFLFMHLILSKKKNKHNYLIWSHYASRLINAVINWRALCHTKMLNHKSLTVFSDYKCQNCLVKFNSQFINQSTQSHMTIYLCSSFLNFMATPASAIPPASDWGSARPTVELSLFNPNSINFFRQQTPNASLSPHEKKRREKEPGTRQINA